MRLKKSYAAADEEILRLVNDGYAVLQGYERDYERKNASGTFDDLVDTKVAEEQFHDWHRIVTQRLGGIFPTLREAFMFVRSDKVTSPRDHDGIDQYFWRHTFKVEHFVRTLDHIRLVDLRRYTDLPVAERLFVEDIDSFAKVRDVNPSAVRNVLKHGRVELSEEHVQVALEQILDVTFHRRDWGGETNDLYTPNVVVNSARTATAFALKGKGCKARELTIANCGKNGDQLLRLLESPAELFVVQYVGPISDAVIKDLAGKVAQRRGAGGRAWFCVIDGQDTARLLKAYGKLPAPMRQRGAK
jgi:hypothetical protein